MDGITASGLNLTPRTSVPPAGSPADRSESAALSMGVDRLARRTAQRAGGNLSQLVAKVKEQQASAPQATDEATFREVLVKQPYWREPDQATEQLANDWLVQHQADIASRLAQLSPEDQATYRAIDERMSKLPLGRVALANLLDRGDLTDPNKLSAEGQTLLASLRPILTAQLPFGLGSPWLLSDLLQEIENPTKIQQREMNTCTVTSLQIKMALDNPAEYARLIAGLAAGEGEVRMANGRMLKRVPDSAFPYDSRSGPSRIWQSALMQLAAGQAIYDNKTDTLNAGPSGLVGDEISRAETAVTGAPFETRMVDLLDVVKAETQAGRSAPVGLRWGSMDPEHPGGGHEVLVTKVEGGFVYYRNPWGSEERMSEAEFNRRAKDATVLAHEPAPSPERGEAHLEKERAALVTHLQAKIKEYRANLEQYEAHPNDETSWLRHRLMDAYLPMCSDLADRLKAMALPAHPSATQRKAIQDTLRTLKSLTTAKYLEMDPLQAAYQKLETLVTPR